jgi:hypothetical protein
MSVYFKAVDNDVVMAFSDTDAAGMRSHPCYTEVTEEEYRKYQDSLGEAIQRKPLKALKKKVSKPAKVSPSPSRTVKPKALGGKPAITEE